MTRLAAVLAAALFPVLALGQNAPMETHDLSAAGEITNWLMLGYIPLTVDPATFDKVLDVDLLASAGGEAKVQPAGGQKVTLPASATIRTPVELTWRLARACGPVVRDFWNPYNGVWLFDDEKGQPLENTACYLYCQLVSPADMTATLIAGSDDSQRIVLNGRVVHRFVGQRSASMNGDRVTLPLRKGVNDLLVRVDNYVGNGGLIAHLADADGKPLGSVKVQLPVAPGAAEIPTRRFETWDKVVSAIPPVKPAEHQEFFGGRLARTMALLESGGQTHRPVRIFFYGQSIEFGWVDMLVQRLREHYPRTEIIAENHAMGGWGVYLLVRAMKHDIVRGKPDLVLFHAYAGTADEWERVFETLRKETCADIITRTAHIDAGRVKDMGTVIDDETLMLRPLAQKYNVELVEVRREWIDYLQDNKIQVSDLLADPIHLNHKGCSLMAQLYERHFRVSTLHPSGWMNNVRYYSAIRPLDQRRYDEITLEGAGWKRVRQGAQATGAGNQLKLKFTGTRLDLVLLPDNGGAKVLIDGKAPSQLGLVHGTRPLAADSRMVFPTSIVQYFTGPNIQIETWELTFKKVSPDGTKFSFGLRGSLTGEDGEGTNAEPFVSKSGRIAIAPNDWLPPYRYTPPAKDLPEPKLAWRIVPDCLDQVQCPSAVPKDWPAQMDYFDYVMVADGLAPGEHELTLIPNDVGSFTIHAVEAFNPPMAVKQ